MSRRHGKSHRRSNLEINYGVSRNNSTQRSFLDPVKVGLMNPWDCSSAILFSISMPFPFLAAQVDNGMTILAAFRLPDELPYAFRSALIVSR